jgi:hypothetical protein
MAVVFNIIHFPLGKAESCNKSLGITHHYDMRLEISSFHRYNSRQGSVFVCQYVSTTSRQLTR